MLSVATSQLKKGLGGLLVKSAEIKAKNNGCVAMRLEILKPRDWEHPMKNMLDKWYTKLGYEKGKLADFSIAFPKTAKNLACPCVFTAYYKKLK